MVNLCLPAEKAALYGFILSVGHTCAVFEVENNNASQTVCNTLFQAIAKLQREKLC